MKARPTYEEITAGLTEEQISSLFHPMAASCGTSIVNQYWGG